MNLMVLEVKDVPLKLGQDLDVLLGRENVS